MTDSEGECKDALLFCGDRNFYLITQIDGCLTNPPHENSPTNHKQMNRKPEDMVADKLKTNIKGGEENK